MELGTNLSTHPYLDYFVGDSQEDLLMQLKQIRTAHQIIAIYAQGVRHTAWVSLSRPIKKQVVVQEIEESPVQTKRKRGRKKARKE